MLVNHIENKLLCDDDAFKFNACFYKNHNVRLSYVEYMFLFHTLPFTLSIFCRYCELNNILILALTQVSFSTSDQKALLTASSNVCGFTEATSCCTHDLSPFTTYLILVTSELIESNNPVNLRTYSATDIYPCSNCSISVETIKVDYLCR